MAALLPEPCESRASPPYRDLPFAHLREAHDRLYYGAWRSPAATPLDFRRAHRQLERYLRSLSQELSRSRSPEGQKALEKAYEAFARADPEVLTSDPTVALDRTLSYAHRALNALLRQYRTPTHDPSPFAQFYDVTEVPFRELS